MTSVYRTPEGEIIVFIKGADSIIFPLCSPQVELQQTTEGFLDAYAKDGLRTLVLGHKHMSEGEYSHWASQMQKAGLLVHGRDEAIDKCALDLEHSFQITGSTAIEDRLQDGVPDSIVHIRKAGIKLWILTGDKIETAINIGYSCGLLDDNLNQYIIDGQKTVDIYK